MTDRHAHAVQLAEHLILGLASCTHRELDDLWGELQLPPPPAGTTEGTLAGVAPTRRGRCQQAADLLDPEQAPALLARFLQRGLPAADRNRVQDVLWARESWPEITERARREVAAALERVAPIWGDADGFMDLLHRLWILESEISLWTGDSLASQIERHVLRNPEDWSVHELCRQIGAFKASDRRFALFVEGLLSGSVNPDEGRQRALVAAVSPALTRAGLKIVESGSTGGYPDFSVVPLRSRGRPPQLILFASTGRKPDLRLREVLDQELEVVGDQGGVLRYAQPVGEQGLTWEHLQAWWAERESLVLEDAKAPLWQRLLAAIPESSPPQRNLFIEYHKTYGQRDGFLALLPEVWLHWDPVAKSVRGDDALLTQRMDFLLLPPGHRRVVLEVDGNQHYAKDGRPSPATYAQTTRGDRDLRLSGYEVYRFGGHELMSERAPVTVADFFDRLLDQRPSR